MMLFRMNVRRSKSLIWILNVAAIICISLLFVTIYKKKTDGKFEAASWEIFQAALEEGVEKNSLDNTNRDIDINSFSALWKANISGIKKVDTVEVDTGPTDQENRSPLEDIVTVGSILMSPVPEESMVRLNYPQNPDTDVLPFRLEIWNKEGDPLKYPYGQDPYHGKVLKISPEEVLFSFRGKEVTLTPKETGDENDYARGVDGKPFIPGVAQGRLTPPKETMEIEPGHFKLSATEYKYVRTDYEKELKQVTITAVKNPKSGKTELKVSQLSDKSLAYKRGFRSGDTLVSVNGFPVHNKAGAINYFKEHPDEGTYVVEINRNGKPIFKTFTVPND